MLSSAKSPSAVKPGTHFISFNSVDQGSDKNTFRLITLEGTAGIVSSIRFDLTSSQREIEPTVAELKISTSTSKSINKATAMKKQSDASSDRDQALIH